MDEDFDDVLKTVGTRGRYQRKMLYFILVPVCFFLGINICQILFQVAVPDHWCHVPGRENTTLSVEEWMEITIPRDNDTGKYSSCQRYTSINPHEDNATVPATNETQECINGWEYDTRQFAATVATTHEWFCEKEGYSANILTLNMAGNAVGTLFLPILADVIGRRLVFFIMLTIHIVFTLAYIWVPYYGLHVAFRFIRGLIELTLYLMPHITVQELIPPEDRDKATTIAWVAWTFGMCLTSLIVWLIPHWQYLALASCIPAILGYSYWWHFPESPRWLLSKGRISECANILIQMNEMNGNKPISRSHMEARLTHLAEQQHEEVSFMRAFKYPKLRLRAIMLFLMSMCLYVVYGVILIGINVLPDNQYLSHFLLSLSELPSNGLGWLLSHYLGRRFTCYSTFSVTALLCLISIFCTHNQWAMMVLVSLIKLFDTTALLVLYLLTAEIFPTPIRSTGLGIMAVFGLFSMALAPSILHSGLGPTFQYWVMLVLMVCSILTSLTMPETIGLPLPQTFQEAENVGSGRPITTWVHYWNQHKHPDLVHPQKDHSTTNQEVEKLKV